jgi:acetyl esterase/lipase
MKRTVKVDTQEATILLASEIVYGQRVVWCGATCMPLKLSLMRPRYFFPYDKKRILPLIVWFCGGGFTEMDRNVHTPELAWFAKRGFAVASVDYVTTYRSHFPQLVEDVKLAIRFLKAHSGEYNIDPNRIVVMGESAGGYLAALCGVTGKNREFDTGGYENYTSEVQAAVPWYPVIRPTAMTVDIERVTVPYDWDKYADVTGYVTKNAAPCLILHGSGDTLVPVSQSELLYDVLERAGADVDMIIIEGAEHADDAFVQSGTKQMILDFIVKKLGISS